jgi:hypothetical protein
VTIEKLSREQIPAAQAAGSPSRNLSWTELEVGLKTKPAVETYLLNLSKRKRLTTHAA